MNTGALASLSAAESEEVSEGSSEVEDSSSAESGPAHSGPAKGGTGGRSGSAAGTKRKPEVGLPFLGVKLKIYERGSRVRSYISWNVSA